MFLGDIIQSVLNYLVIIRIIYIKEKFLKEFMLNLCIRKCNYYVIFFNIINFLLLLYYSLDFVVYVYQIYNVCDIDF